MDLRPFAAFLFGTHSHLAVESPKAVRFLWGPAIETIHAEEQQMFIPR